jgi:plasmid stabilization system protein ParE
LVGSSGRGQGASRLQMKPVDFTPSARDELRAAIDWYESRSQGLGRRFFEVIDAALAAIVNAPSAFPAWAHDERVRKFVVDAFPYVVFYR